MTIPGRFLLAVDIGGTFTDLVLLDLAKHRLQASKLLTTYPDPSEAVLSGVRRLSSELGVPTSEVQGVIHGTTLVTNALIQRRGAAVALLTTEGFRDALEIGNEGRYDLYDLRLVKPTPLVERRRRFEVAERMSAEGTPLRPILADALHAVCDELLSEGIEAVAVCYLHAYANPSHELATAAVLAERLTGVSVTLSHQVAPTIREYQRTSTTVANAYVQPMTERYLRGLEAGLRGAGISAPLNVMLSNGGTCTVDTAAAFPIRLVESGPSGGALAGAYWGKRLGRDEVLAFDMGGTTAKAVLTDGGEFAVTSESEVAHVRRFMRGSGLPLLVPMIQMIEIGAGGGSIAHLNELGLPTVGPESAGSDPGPACYGLGGHRPTVTDADLLLGYLNPDAFAQNTLTLDPGAARESCAPLADALGLSVERVAWGIHELVNENMAAAARVHAAERGLDTRRYAMIATGGAGPVHACGVARRLGVDTVVVPPLAGVGSAFGFLLAPIAFDFTRSYLVRFDRIDIDHLNAILSHLEDDGREIVIAAGVPPEDIAVERTVDIRYLGQGYEIRVPLAHGVVERQTLEVIQSEFEQRYARYYGGLSEGVPLEAVNWRVVVAGPSLEVRPASRPSGGTPSGAGSRRPALFDADEGFTDTPAHRRDQLSTGFTIDGPAIIEEAESTTVVGPGWHVRLDDTGCLVLESSRDASQ